MITIKIKYNIDNPDILNYFQINILNIKII